MEIDIIHKANQILFELDRWKDIETRISCDVGCSIIFEAFETKSMNSKYRVNITDKKTIDTYHEYVKSMIEKYETELKEL